MTLLEIQIKLLRQTKAMSPAIARAKGAYKIPSGLKEAIKSGKLRAEVGYQQKNKRELNNRKSITIKLNENGK